jgi:hypothetical protein
MSTSGGGVFNAIGYMVILGAFLAAVRVVTNDVEVLLRRVSRAALALWMLVAVPSVVQIAYHPLLHALSRQPSLIRHHHELWRLLTSAFVQDGGIAGTVFNLLVLYLVGCLAVRVWGPARAVALFLAGALAFDVMAVYAFSFSGAGNSGATFFLATSVLGALVVRRYSIRILGYAVVAAVGAVALTAVGDAHGLAFLGGLVAGAVLALCTPLMMLHPPAGSQR